MTTIKEEFAQRHQLSDHSLEDRLENVTRGQYVYSRKFDQKYPYWQQLFRHCAQWIAAHADGPYVEYKTEADMMSWAMHQMGEADKKVPQPWVPAIHRLRALQKEASRQVAPAR